MTDVKGESRRFIFEGEKYKIPKEQRSRSDKKYEYMATLIDKDSGQIYARFDSKQDAIPSQYGLTKKQVMDALNEIKEDVENGRASAWF